MNSSSPKFELPRGDEHTAIVGRNGSGKTQMGAWLLSKQDLKKNVWVVVDYKREEIFGALNNARQIGFRDIPEEPGLYILSSRPDLEAETEGWLWRLWDHGHAGLYVDEGYMLPQIARGAFQAILTQGRSLRIPAITLTQRPVRVTPFAFSEASHVAVFDLNRRKDWQTIEENTVEGFSEWLPPGLTDLPRFNARWWASKKKTVFHMKPVPDAKTIIKDLDRQLERKTSWF